ncbi:folylpolyglutamate synthase [Fusarium chlamydosporum]
MASTQEIKFALSRINRVLKGKRTEGYRDIRLGLDRINKVVPKKQEWKGIHVAGTNGKGSICTFLAGLFKLAVTINGLYVNPRMYEMEMQHVQEKWQRIATGWTYQHGDDPKGLSPFEAETATAFRVFNKMHVPYGIVEVGMGGATDATNAMKRKAITIISKIGLDHQEYLGNTIENIAKVKAGIMQRNVPCIVDHTNSPAVIRVLRQHAREIGTEIILTWKAEPLLLTLNNAKWRLESYQIQNLLCAAMAFRHLFPLQEINLGRLMATHPILPGRLETVYVDAPTSGVEARKMLVDGAHNMLGIEELASFVKRRLREPGEPVTWVMGMSASKDKPLLSFIDKLVQPHDNFAMVEFTRGPNDPEPAPANFGTDYAKTLLQSPDQVYDGAPDISAALPWAFSKANGGPVVVTGSLYLIRQLLALKGVRRKWELGTRRPGRSQLYRLTKLARENKLTRTEAREFKEARRHFELSPNQSPIFSRKRKEGKVKQVKIMKVNVPRPRRLLQKKAAFHKNQALSYRRVIKSLRMDIQMTGSAQQELATPVTNLQDRIEDLEKQVAKHNAEYAVAMFKLRGYTPIPHMKYRTHRQIFGYVKKPKAPTKSPFVIDKEPAKAEKKKSKKKPSLAWKDRKETFSDKVAAAEKQRELAMREAATREAAKNSSDALEAKLVANRRDMGGSNDS